MSVLPASLRRSLRRETDLIVTFLAAWAGGTGVVMMFNWRTISAQTAWQPAQFGDRHAIIVYGIIFAICCPPMVVAAHRPEWWRYGICAEIAAGFLALFLAFTLVIEAFRSKQGALGAINYVFIAMVLGVVIRSTLRDHPFGGP